MRYAQFFKFDLSGKLSEAVGDRGVLIIDGRVMQHTAHSHARDWCKKHGYNAWQLRKGKSFTDSWIESHIRMSGE